MKMFTLMMPDELHREVKIQAINRDISASRLIQEILTQYLSATLPVETKKAIEARLQKPLGRPPMTATASGAPREESLEVGVEEQELEPGVSFLEGIDDPFDPKWDGNETAEGLRKKPAIEKGKEKP